MRGDRSGVPNVKYDPDLSVSAGPASGISPNPGMEPIAGKHGFALAPWSDAQLEMARLSVAIEGAGARVLRSLDISVLVSAQSSAGANAGAGTVAGMGGGAAVTVACAGAGAGTIGG